MGLPLLNPSIIAQGPKPVDVPDPMEQMKAIEQLRQVRNQNALAPLKAQELQGQVQETAANTQRVQLANQNTQRDQKDAEEYQQAMLGAGPDPDKIEAAALNYHNPNVQAKLLDTASKQRARQATITAKQHDEFVKLSTGAASDLQAIDDAKDNAPLQLGLWSQLTQKLSTAKDESGNPLFPPGTLDPTKVPDSKTIKVLQTMADKTGEYHAKAAKLQDEADKAAKAKADLDETLTKTQVAKTQQAASLLGKSQTAEEFRSIKGTLDPKIAVHFPDPPNGKTGPLDEDFLSNVRQRGMTPDQQATTQGKSQEIQTAQQRANEEMLKAGIDPELAKQATDPKATPAQRTAAGQRVMEQASSRKVSEAVREEIGKQVGVMNALLGGGFGGGVQPVSAPVPAPAGPSQPVQPRTALLPGSQSPIPTVIASPQPQQPQPTLGGPQATPVPAQRVQPPAAPLPQAQPIPASQAPAVPTPTGTDRNEAALSKVSAPIATRVRAIADGRAPMPPQGRNNPLNTAITNLLYAYDPAFDVSNAGLRIKTENGFGPDGKEGQALNAAGTAMTHAGKLSDLIENLDNTSFPKYNSFANWIKNNSGSPEVKQFVNTRDKFADELAKAWGANALGDRKAAIDTLNAADSPEALRKVMADDIDLLHGKTGELESQYKSVMNKSLASGRGVSDEAKVSAQKVLGRRDGQSAANSVTLKGGRIAVFPDKKSADAFRRDHADKIQ